MNSYARRLAATALVVAGSVAGPACAVTLSAQEALTEFNLIVLGDLKSKQHVDGRTYVGGNLNAQNASVFNMHGGPASIFADLYVGGNLTGNGVQVNTGGSAQVLGSATRMALNGSGGSLKVGGNLSDSSMNSAANHQIGGNVTNSNFNGGVLEIGGSFSNGDLNNGTTVKINGAFSPRNSNGTTVLRGQATPPKFDMPAVSDMRSLMETTSDALALFAKGFGVKPTLSATNDASFTGSGSFTYFNVTSDEFNNWRSVDFSLDPDETLIINVDVLPGGAQPKLSSAFNMNGGNLGYAGQVLWNFANAMELGLAKQLVGSVLAPRAYVDQGSSGTHEGTLVAASMRMQAEVHSQPFTGSYTPPSADTPPPAVPVPAALPLMGLALGGFGWLRMRRRG